MSITDVKNVDFSNFWGTVVKISDTSATAQEILNFLNSTPFDVTYLTFDSGCAIPPHLGKIKELKLLSIVNTIGNEIDEGIFKIPIEIRKISS